MYVYLHITYGWGWVIHESVSDLIIINLNDLVGDGIIISLMLCQWPMQSLVKF